MRQFIAMLAVLTLISACDRQGQNSYNEADVGVANVIQFGRVVSARKVDIKPKNTGVGELAGGGAGLAAGSADQGAGRGWVMAAGALIGAVAGHYAEQGIMDREGMEYIVKIDHGRTLSIVQNINDGDVVFKPGDKVMVQQCEAGEYYKKCVEGGYQRVLPVGNVEDNVKAARKKWPKRTSDDESDE